MVDDTDESGLCKRESANKNAKNGVAYTIVAVIALSIISKFFGLIRDVMIGSKFGTSLESDVYFTALKGTTALFISAGVAITTNAIPVIIAHNSKGSKNAEQGGISKNANSFVSNILSILSFTALMICVVGMFLLPYYLDFIAHGFDENKLNLTIQAARLIFPSIIFIFAVYVFNSVLQSHNKFFITTITSLPYNIIIILYMIFGSKHFGVYGLAICTTLGWALQAIVQIPAVSKLGYKLNIHKPNLDSEARKFLNTMLPLLISSAVYSVNVLIDTSLATTLADGRLSALNYASTAYLAISQTLIYAVGTVLFPKFSENASKNDLKTLSDQVTSTIKMLIFIVLPLICGLIALSKPVIQFVFQRGAFDIESARLTSIALSFYSLGMFGFAIQDILSRVFYSLRDTKTPMKYSIMSVVINAILNIILIRFMDLAGLALATSIATIVNSLLLYRTFSNKFVNFNYFDTLSTLIKSLISAIIMGVIVFISFQVISKIFGFRVFIQEISVLISCVLIGVIAYYILAKVMKIEALELIMDKLRRKV